MDLLQELQSETMLRRRRHTIEKINKMSDANSGLCYFYEITAGYMLQSCNLEWSPGCGKNLWFKYDSGFVPNQELHIEDEQSFVDSSGVSGLIGFIARVELCREKGLIDEDLTDAILYSWFLHYFPFLDSFCQGLKYHMSQSEIDRVVNPGWMRALESAVKRMRKIAKLPPPKPLPPPPGRQSPNLSLKSHDKPVLPNANSTVVSSGNTGMVMSNKSDNQQHRKRYRRRNRGK